MGTVTRTLELSEEAAAELDRRALAAERTPAEVLDFLLLDDEVAEEDFPPKQWQEIQDGIRQSDEGLFASEAEVGAVFSKPELVKAHGYASAAPHTLRSDRLTSGLGGLLPAPSLLRQQALPARAR